MDNPPNEEFVDEWIDVTEVEQGVIKRVKGDTERDEGNTEGDKGGTKGDKDNDEFDTEEDVVLNV